MNEESRASLTLKLEVPFSNDELSAIEGWRQANRLDSLQSAARQLVRLGLLSEIGRVYQEVTSDDR